MLRVRVCRIGCVHLGAPLERVRLVPEYRAGRVDRWAVRLGVDDARAVDFHCGKAAQREREATTRTSKGLTAGVH